MRPNPTTAEAFKFLVHRSSLAFRTEIEDTGSVDTHAARIFITDTNPRYLRLTINFTTQEAKLLSITLGGTRHIDTWHFRFRPSPHIDGADWHDDLGQHTIPDKRIYTYLANLAESISKVINTLAV